MKIDVTKIDGYEQMSAEDKIKALTEFEYEDGRAEIEKYKNAVSKANTEAAEWKKKHNALLSAEEQKKQADDEAISQMKAELENLRMEKVISGHTTEFMKLGYDEGLARESATALANGDLVTVFANTKKFLTSHDKTITANTLKNTPPPPAGGSTNGFNYTKAIGEAQARGDMTTVAALIRQQQEQLK